MTQIDPRAREARSRWRYRGRDRPAFAIEPRQGQESVWDYPRPPALVADERRVEVRCEEALVAESSRTYRVLETASPPTFYIPRQDVRTGLLEPGRGASHCEWKGRARYWSVRIAGRVLENVAWSYEDPYPEFAAIRGYLSFYPARLDCYVGGHRAAPQPGGFYGGWVTPEIVGPCKGEPGSEAW